MSDRLGLQPGFNCRGDRPGEFFLGLGIGNPLKLRGLIIKPTPSKPPELPGAGLGLGYSKRHHNWDGLTASLSRRGETAQVMGLGMVPKHPDSRRIFRVPRIGQSVVMDRQGQSGLEVANRGLAIA